MDKHALLREIVGNLQAATAAALALIRRAVPVVRTLGETPCHCQSALAQAIWTDRARIPEDVRSRLRPLLARYLES